MTYSGLLRTPALGALAAFDASACRHEWGTQQQLQIELISALRSQIFLSVINNEQSHLPNHQKQTNFSKTYKFFELYTHQNGYHQVSLLLSVTLSGLFVCVVHLLRLQSQGLCQLRLRQGHWSWPRSLQGSQQERRQGQRRKHGHPCQRWYGRRQGQGPRDL